MSIDDQGVNSLKYIDVEEEIRPLKRQKENFSLVEGDIKELIEPFLEDFLFINCPNCNKRKSSEEFTKGLFSFCLCNDCGTLFVNPRPSRSILDLFYSRSKSFHGMTQSLFDNEAGRKKYIFVPRAKLILEFLKENGVVKGDLLEVGCSIGTMLSIFKDKSQFNVFGIDPSPLALEVTEKRGLDVYPVTIEEFDEPEKTFDVVLSFETIEHLFWPIELVQKVYNILSDGGYFIFTTPNYHGFDMLILGRDYKRILAPFHLNYFNIKTIDTLLNLAGLRVVDKSTPGMLDIINVKKQLEEGNAPSIDKFTRHLLFSTSTETQNEFQKFLSEHCLSSHMLVFAQKDSNMEDR
jgi:2-polyprenyl-3-methyl-5-hydroxy-6-metoxy-1,4-benzoquinol methylase